MLVIFVAMFTCAMTAPLVPMPEEAKSNASTTKLQLVEGKSKSVIYRKDLGSFGCCEKNGTFHQRCHCKQQLATCKTQCDADANCKGYVQAVQATHCQLATTSSCPSSCTEHNAGNVGPLVNGSAGVNGSLGSCGIGYGGCYIKLKGDFEIGDWVQLSANTAEVKNAFDTTNYIWGDIMTPMLGKNFIVMAGEVDGAVGLPSPDGSQGGIWWFPASVISQQVATEAPTEEPTEADQGSAGTWIKGENGAICDNVCSASGYVCDASTQSSLTDASSITAAFSAAGYTCTNVGGHRDYAGAPFSTGGDNDCYYLTPGGKASVCDANQDKRHSPLCYCIPEEPTEAPTEPPTEAPTEPPTEAPTEPPTEAPTEPPTEAPTEPPTEAPTEPPTEAPTEAAQKTDECLAKSYACANYGTCCGNNNYRKHGHKLICREAKKMRPCSSGTTCSAGEIPTAELCPPAADLTEEEKKIKEQCEAEIADIVAQKVIHDARVKAVEEFQESVDGDFCGKDEIKEWLESLDDKAKRNEEKITKGCEIETKMITTPLSDVITTLDCEGTTSDCIPAEEVTKIVEEAETLTEENQKLVEECEKTVTNLKTEKPIHTEEITALEEFETHVGDDWCGKSILEEFIEEKKGKWTPSQDKIDEDCQTINKESETLQEIQKILTNSVVDE